MPFYRKKPVVVEAEQFTDLENPPQGVRIGPFTDGTNQFYVVTIHGQNIVVVPGDWIITEMSNKDRHYPCKPDVFEATYDRLA